MKENDLLQRRNVKLCNFAATRLPRSGIKKSLPSRGGMKENDLLQRRNVKLCNFAATRLPRSGIKKSLPSRGGMKENDLLQRRNVKLRNFSRFDFNAGIAHVSGFDHKPLAPGQLGGQIVKIAAV